MSARDYSAIAAALGESIRPGATFEERMRAVVDGLWAALSQQRVSWCGFYLPGESQDELVLGPRRDRPACSPIGLGGVCGRAWRERRPVVVRDVAQLGAAYVACDPRDRAEVVIPLLDEAGRPRAVLDLDSHELAAFDGSDVEGLRSVLAAAGL